LSHAQVNACIDCVRGHKATLHHITRKERKGSLVKTTKCIELDMEAQSTFTRAHTWIRTTVSVSATHPFPCSSSTPATIISWFVRELVLESRWSRELMSKWYDAPTSSPDLTNRGGAQAAACCQPQFNPSKLAECNAAQRAKSNYAGGTNLPMASLERLSVKLPWRRNLQTRDAPLLSGHAARNCRCRECEACNMTKDMPGLKRWRKTAVKNRTTCRL